MPHRPDTGHSDTGRDATKHRQNRCLKVALPTFLAAVLTPVLAQAHAILEESAPPAGAAVKAGKLELRLRYNSRIDRTRSRLTLIRPDNRRDMIPIAPIGAPDIVSARLELPPGAYVVRWQVLAIDGHITRGDLPITVTAP